MVATVIIGMTTPEICFLPDIWGGRSCPRSATVIHSHLMFAAW